MKRLRRRPAPVVFCGEGNKVCSRRAVARELREQSKASAAFGHLAWK
ncbi:MAG TPA: hypothetical protein VNU01_02755 [Egibacteraceae bacterium]|nr:hypothetical protein [Egibacteraceae bacterium]